jgi:putative hemolysin
MRTLYLPTWLLSGLCLLAAASCSKNTAEPEDGKVEVSYAQTQCADPSGSVKGNLQLVAAASTYLASKGITLTNAHASQTGTAATCLACTCGTGVVLTGRVDSTQLAAVQALRFKKL